MDGKLTEREIEHLRQLATLFAQKWTISIIVALQNGQNEMGFNELMKNLNGISAAVLSNRLKNLQRLGYVTREVRVGPPTRTKYTLTGRVKTLLELADVVFGRDRK